MLLREARDRLGLDRRLDALPDRGDPDRVTYSLHAGALRARVMRLAQGRRDQRDANLLRYDAAFRLSVSDAAGRTPPADHAHPPSQPTLSRLGHGLASEAGTAALDALLVATSLARIRAAEAFGYLAPVLDAAATVVRPSFENARPAGY